MPTAFQPSTALAADLLRVYGSPLYVYDGDRFLQTLHHIAQAIPYPRTRFHFATVTNGSVALLQIVRDAGWGLHANTPGDIYLGLQAGFEPRAIVYSGSNLSRDDMAQVLTWGVATLNLDSLTQLEQLCEIYQTQDSAAKHPSLRLGLRLNDPALTGDSRIGVRPEEFAIAQALVTRANESIGAANLKLCGLHFYRGTGTNATQAFTQVIDRVVSLGQQLPDWAYLDFGGGFGHPYRHGGAVFDWAVFGEGITAKLNQLSPPVELVIEPGRAAIAGCAALLTTVVSVKWQGDKQIAGVDTTVANLSVPSVHGGYREIVALAPSSSPQTYPTDVCGNTTYSRDYLGRNCQLPKLAPGDTLAVLDVGAYGYAMASHFLHRPRPAEVLLQAGQHRLIRRRESYQTLIHNQIF
ncbi:decarboxylase [Leptolyngbya sp. CCNP1308]|uniref:diaminopimelate decarboxylase family protein n=1 Tax=Leptolyngbya sp. CCNP1308 TaxID=3110255 RepID=UPI002B1F1A7F|nr:decarboxylase [Leptolyngbya sp. CCNP1308]MEA5449492.1 decarboxylase [Leptolyngbya sp. CCNP1308]